jgi:iron-sulfur cluster repair protein YtfE (RIC family)
MMEHFDLDLTMQDKSVEQICHENQLNKTVFIAIANLYNGFNEEGIAPFETNDVKAIIAFLKNSHQFYLNEKIPEIQGIINQLFQNGTNRKMEIKLIEDFFTEYSQEVKEHLDYEDDIAFPYFLWLLSATHDPQKAKNKFSAEEYQDHHTDIETKLNDLKQLLVKHISLKDDRSLKLMIVPGVRIDYHHSEEEYKADQQVFASANFPKTDFDETSINPRVALKYELSPRVTLRVAAGTGFRAPYGFSEDLHLCSGSPRVWKSSDLDPETSVSYNLSADYDGNRIRLSANLFRTDLTDKIGFTDADKQVAALGYDYQWKNIDDAFVRVR